MIHIDKLINYVVFQCARAVQKYFQDKALAAQKAEKAQEVQLKKIASFAAKEIRTFWSNVEKVSFNVAFDLIFMQTSNQTGGNDNYFIQN